MMERALQLPLFRDADLMAGRLTPFDQELLGAIQRAAGADGDVRSLFRVAVLGQGLHYSYALYRLSILEGLGYVTVVRSGPGLPLIIRPVG